MNELSGGLDVRVVIAEDAVLLRAGVQRLLADDGIETVAAVGSGEELLTSVTEHEPDLAIVDVRMPPTFTDEGLRAALQAREIRTGLPVLVLSQYVEETYAIELLSGGAGGVGYLLKERVSDVTDFLEAVRRVAAGGTAIDPEVISQVMARGRNNPLDSLTGREGDVLELMAQGLSNSAIAARMVVSHGAVEKHIGNIFAKLGLDNSVEEHRRVRAVLTYLER
ncbi:DNA-binding NarL/FixJ family response regulator [Prauserella sediminis]|uniref:DNA-binding NarL/FixJ family response regulator n=1 Tax=Prauserella sediminis TaxID=577680 RepID=A0A839XLW6_9PSEU|nr:DNA-binding NarL/FixJ family response regulator [Prauserella sediminis]